MSLLAAISEADRIGTGNSPGPLNALLQVPTLEIVGGRNQHLRCAQYGDHDNCLGSDWQAPNQKPGYRFAVPGVCLASA